VQDDQLLPQGKILGGQRRVRKHTRPDKNKTQTQNIRHL
jgi:hypothetical protein